MPIIHTEPFLFGQLTAQFLDQQTVIPSQTTGPFEISNDVKAQREKWIIQQRTLLIQDRQMEVLQLQKSAILLGIIAEILGFLDLEILSTNA
ncbi:hypothetical protein PDQ36_08230 [Bacillus cereus]|uniref:hypothetical protein n=1 Tax=Bacillus thuringiensis TaxID=1428 RepID=UPI002DC01514|nr:hypothetical protein [Bacillus cereus]MEB9379850.1 hypothetical protein [Bacillus cereus]